MWKGTFVTPNVLTRAIAQLRKALGDDAFEARYVETVSKRGYRFIADAQPLPSEVVVPLPLAAQPLALASCRWLAAYPCSRWPLDSFWPAVAIAVATVALGLLAQVGWQRVRGHTVAATRGRQRLPNS